MSKNTINPPRGMRDILPAEMRIRYAALTTIISTYEKFGFTQIETPAVENLNILSKDTESENTKLVFSILKRGEEIDKAMQANDVTALTDLGLRYDLTVPLARYYASNRATLPGVFKSIQIGPVWRAERPQKGRYRQFYQCDIDILGSNSIYSELELITASSSALLSLGLKNFIIRMNDRRILSAIIQYCGFAEEYTQRILIILDKIEKIGIQGIREELNNAELDADKIEVLLDLITTQTNISPEQSLQQLKQQIGQYLDANIINELDLLIKQINAHSGAQYSCVFDFTLVRGMGYYTGPVFEISYKDYPFSIAGGGRYDNMINQLIGNAVPACGISLGFERIIVIINEEQILTSPKLETIALIVDSMAAQENVMTMANNLWNTKKSISIYKREKNFTKQLNDLLLKGINQYMTIDNNGILSEIKEISLKVSEKKDNCLSTS